MTNLQNLAKNSCALCETICVIRTMKNPNVAIFSFSENRHESVLTYVKNAVREMYVLKDLVHHYILTRTIPQ